ncbi:MAG: hypothetical protein LUI07_05310 [Lachnospiraceae bacterium]|nr:hypothetical protein [Lachnospiraceae bacterium]
MTKRAKIKNTDARLKGVDKTIENAILDNVPDNMRISSIDGGVHGNAALYGYISWHIYDKISEHVEEKSRMWKHPERGRLLEDPYAEPFEDCL